MLSEETDSNRRHIVPLFKIEVTPSNILDQTFKYLSKNRQMEIRFFLNGCRTVCVDNYRK